MRFVIIDDGTAVDIDIRIDGDRAWLSREAVKLGLGWELESEGLCRDGVCFTIRRGTMPMRGIDPMGPEFRAMLGEWVGSGNSYYRPLPL